MTERTITTLLGERCTVLLADGTRIEGTLASVDGEWWWLDGDDGELVVNPRQVAAIATGGGMPAPKPARKRGAGGGSPGRPWAEEHLRALADGFLDGETDKELAARFERTPAIVRQLRQAFEVARGNLDQEQVTEVAATWIGRWREVLSP